MEELVGLCEDYVTGNVSDSNRQELTCRIVKNTSDILHLVQSLRLYLTSVDVDVRLAATTLLSEVLIKVTPSGTLLKEDVHYLVEFFCDRLKDRVLLLPSVLAALQALIGHEALLHEDVVLVVRGIFKEVQCQALSYEVRHIIFSIFRDLLTDHMKVLETIGEEVVLGYVELMAGERDPRNLLLVFSSVTLILHHLHFDTLLEELFDVVSCYFPIDFSPSPGEEGITREALMEGLRDCLIATDKFGQLVIPLLLEKLSSDVLQAKLDSLDVLVHGVRVYGAAVINDHADALWISLKTQMFQSLNSEVQVGCVAVVTALTTALSSSTSTTQLDNFIILALRDCQRHLSEPGLRLMEPVVQLLAGIALASDHAASTVMTAVVPVLLSQCSSNSQASTHKAVLDALLVFVNATRYTSSSHSNNKEANVNPLSSCQPSLVELLSVGLHSKDSKTRTTGIRVLTALAAMEGVLEVPQVVKYGEYLKELARASTPRTEVLGSLDDERGYIQDCLAAIGWYHPELVRDHLLPPMIQELKSDIYRNIWFLPYFCSSTPVVDKVVSGLVEVIISLLSGDKVTVASDTAWSHATMLTNILLETVEEQHQERGMVKKLGVVPICIPTLRSILQCCSHVISNGLSANVTQWMLKLAKVLASCARHGNISWCEEAMKLLLDAVRVDIMVDVSSSDYQFAPLIVAMLQASPSQVIDEHRKKMCSVLFNMAIMTTDGEMGLLAAKGYSSIINKSSNAEWISNTIHEHKATVWPMLRSHGNSDDRSSNLHQALTLYVWLTKALVMRGHSEGVAMACELIGLCAVGDIVGKEAAEGIQLILVDQLDVLNRQCHAVVRLLYRQQLFVHLLPEIMRLCSEVMESQKKFLLLSLSCLLASVPQQVVLSELHKVLPLLLESLSSEESGVKVSSLQVILGVLQDKPSSLAPHVQALLPQLLLLSSDSSSMNVRRLALQCVGVVSTLPAHLIFPFKQKVIKSLAPILDDHKRLVRKAAVESRALWYLL